MNTLILNRIAEIQRGRIGIYPYRVAQDIASEFLIPIHEAIAHVSYHVKTEMLSEMYPNLGKGKP